MNNMVESPENRRLSSRPSFSAALPIYILRRIYRRMCVFLISWLHKPHACAHRCTDASRSTNIQRCTNSYPLSPPLHPLVFARFLVHPLASSHFYINPRSFIRFSLSHSLDVFISFHFLLLFLFTRLQSFRIFSARFLLSSLAHFVIL